MHRADGRVHGLLPAEPAHEAAEADVDVGEHEIAAADDEQRQVIDALDLRPRDVHDLLVEQRLAQEDLRLVLPSTGAQLRQLDRERDRIGRPGAHLAPRGDQHERRLSRRSDVDLLDRRIGLAEPDREVLQPSDGRAVAVHDPPREQVREIQEAPPCVDGVSPDRISVAIPRSVGDSPSRLQPFSAAGRGIPPAVRPDATSPRVRPGGAARGSGRPRSARPKASRP